MHHAADEIFRIVPRGTLPPGRPVVVVEGDHALCYLITEGTPLPEAVAEMNQLATHLIRHGLWRPQPEETTPPRLRHVS